MCTQKDDAQTKIDKLIEAMDRLAAVFERKQQPEAEAGSVPIAAASQPYPS